MKQHSYLKIKICMVIISICFILTVLVGLFLTFDWLFGDKPKQVEPKPMTQAEIQFSKHDAWIEDQFSKYDGRNIKLVNIIKPKLNDPKSFEHVETHYNRQGDDIIVFMTYRAKNEYGAIMIGVIKAKVYYDKDIIEIL